VRVERAKRVLQVLGMVNITVAVPNVNQERFLFMRASFLYRIVCVSALLFTSISLRAVTLEEIQTQIDTILARPAVVNNTWSISVQNLTGTYNYFDLNPGTTRKPASNTKLFTTATAFAQLGTTHRFETEVYINGTLSNGTLNGDIILISEHDFTWSTRFYATARTPLDQIAQQCYNLGLRTISATGRIIARGECVYDEVVSNSSAAAAFKAALTAKGISCKKSSTVGETGFAPSGTLFTTWNSVTLEQACRPLNKSSVNVFADSLLRHIGWRISGANTYTAGANVVLSWLTSIGINTTGIVMQDGSGLSHNNRFNAVQTLQLVRYMVNNFPTFDDTLPIGCVDGTIGSRFCGTAGAGNVHAKTGTLTGVVALSGYIYNVTDADIYLFSFLANNVSDEVASRDAIDDAVLVMSQAGIPNDGSAPGMQVIVDNSDPAFSVTGAWTTGTSAAGKFGADYRYHGTGTSADEATWAFNVEGIGNAEVFAWWSAGSNRSTAAPYTIFHASGSTTIAVNQQANGGAWQSLGTYTFNAGATQVRLGTAAPTGFVVIADAIKVEAQ
jgi:D-alanyl-D-alanine carboxypeptidase